jgi:putative radical SAM enzyme (TIGR03279 family)
MTEAKNTRPKGLLIVNVEPGSIAEEVGIEREDELLAVNGNPLRDVIDYKFYSTEEELQIEVIKQTGEIWEIEIEKEYDEELGLEFSPMKIRQCPNECEFCFVDQMPAGYRKSLYIRDEDYRFSFMFGNYITLTNLSKRDKERIYEQRLSPLYISVHTTDVELRKNLLKNENAPPILPQISEMVGKGIDCIPRLF